MGRLAARLGLGSQGQDWAAQYAQWCAKFAWDAEGVSPSQFSRLLDDEQGHAHLKDEELAEWVVELKARASMVSMLFRALDSGVSGHLGAAQLKRYMQLLHPDATFVNWAQQY